MNLPEPKFFTLDQLAKRWSISIEEILNYGVSGELYIGTMISNELESFDAGLDSDYKSRFVRINAYSLSHIHEDEQHGKKYISQKINKKMENVYLEQILIPLNEIQKMENIPQENEIDSETYNNLMKAIQLFPEKYTNYENKPLNKSDVESWLTNTKIANNTRQADTFATILQEHYGYSPKIK